MEDKRIIYLIVIVIVAIALSIGVGILLYQRINPQPTPLPPPEQPSQLDGALPHLDTATSTPSAAQTREQQQEKEKQFISSFYRSIPAQYEINTARYALPIPSIKDDVDNYRDFSRKVTLDKALDKLSTNGFVVIPDPFESKATDWETSYRTLAQRNVPIFITADSVLSTYISTLQIIYKEIEQESFYPSLWNLLSQLSTNVKLRYEFRRQQVGIENNLLAEADRLELAYLTVALKLLAPEKNQIRTSLTADSPFFSIDDAKRYEVTVPDYLTDQVTKELQLIQTRARVGTSPIFLYEKNYERYTVPKQYQSSEKLKNYYLAISWLNDALFPLWQRDNTCTTCLLDPEDHRINFVAALALSSDLANNQELQNRWANIYKAISFFKGLEANITYLDYNRAISTIFGDTATLDTVFIADRDTVNRRIAQLQKELSGYQFSSILSDIPDAKNSQGLRLLRNRYLIEQRVLPSMTGVDIGEYLGIVTPVTPGPFTVCQQNKKFLRCTPMALDLFNVTGNTVAATVLNDTENARFPNYQSTINKTAGSIQKFTDNTWHDNLYLNVLFAQKTLEHSNATKFPSFMDTPAWRSHSLVSGLGAWVELHRDPALDRIFQPDTTNLASYFPYGYVQPEPQLYHELLASTEMVLDGFTALQIIDTNSKSFERLNTLKTILETLTEITKLELQNQPLSSNQYAFINNFSKQIRGVLGDIEKDSIALNTQFISASNSTSSITEQLDGIEYLIAIYPGIDGKKFLAIGPTYHYVEKNNSGKISTAWQNIFKP